MSAPTREVKCQACPWQGMRWYGKNGILVDPCPLCGSHVTYAKVFAGDQPLTLDVTVLAAAA